jgi:hypothetical protein
LSAGKGILKDEPDASSQRASVVVTLGSMSVRPTHAPRRPGLAGTVALYTAARLALLAVVAGALVLAGVPLVVAVLVGLIVALPLSMVLFRGLRARLDAALAEAGERRAGERAALRARLRGDDREDGGDGAADGSDDQPEREADGRGH